MTNEPNTLKKLYLPFKIKLKLIGVRLLLATLVYVCIIGVIAMYVGKYFPFWHLDELGLNKNNKGAAEVLRNIIWTIGFLLGGWLGVLGFVNAIHRTQQKDLEIEQKDRELKLAEKSVKDERIAKRRQIDTEIFARSINQLGHVKQEVRLGGLFSIETLALTASKRKKTTNNKAFLNSLLETLAAFVRMSTPIPPQNEQGKDDRVATDVEAAIRIISRTFKQDLREKIKAVIDLRDCYLPKLEMPKVSDMQGFDLMNSVLSGASLNNVNLSKANLCNASLNQVNLCEANLNEVDFRIANLSEVVLFHVNNLDASQLHDAIWNPDSPPSTHIFQSDDTLQSIIDDRTEEIREYGLWETYLAR